MNRGWRVLGFCAGWGAVLTVAAQESPSAAGSVPGAPGSETAANPAPRAERREARPTEPAPTINNPLEGYLGNWMTSRDYALLRGEAAKPATAADAWRKLATEPARKPAAKPSVLAPTGNPYIEAMTAAAQPPAVPSSVAQPGPTPAPVAASDVAPSLAAPESPPPPAASAGYRPPPATDAKYFPQLKRF